MFAAANGCLGQCCRFKDVGNTVHSGIMVLMILVMHIFGLYAVDLIEGWILLKEWVHPYQWRCFILTRTLLFPHKQPVAYRRMMARTLSEPVGKTKEIVAVRQECRRRRMLTSLAYLDLTYNQQGRDSASRRLRRRDHLHLPETKKFRATRALR